jgi:hypothetical protein
MGKAFVRHQQFMHDHPLSRCGDESSPPSFKRGAKVARKHLSLNQHGISDAVVAFKLDLVRASMMNYPRVDWMQMDQHTAPSIGYLACDAGTSIALPSSEMCNPRIRKIPGVAKLYQSRRSYGSEHNHTHYNRVTTYLGRPPPH